jgi:hypothetical protein
MYQPPSALERAGTVFFTLLRRQTGLFRDYETGVAGTRRQISRVTGETFSAIAYSSSRITALSLS